MGSSRSMTSATYPNAMNMSPYGAMSSFGQVIGGGLVFPYKFSFNF